jgi:hypothetical protein
VGNKFMTALLGQDPAEFRANRDRRKAAKIARRASKLEQPQPRPVRPPPPPGGPSAAQPPRMYPVNGQQHVYPVNGQQHATAQPGRPSATAARPPVQLAAGEPDWFNPPAALAAAGEPPTLPSTRPVYGAPQRVGAQQADLKQRAPQAVPSSTDGSWELGSVTAPEPRGRRWMRIVAFAVAAIVLLVGALNITRNVASFFADDDAPPRQAPDVSDFELGGFAEVFATDYLSWDTGDRATREVALARYAAPRVDVDGWDGSGRQWATTASSVGITRSGTDGTAGVVTVRVQVVPYRETKEGASAPARKLPSDAGDNAASGPDVTAAGWTPEPQRWLNLAVAVAQRDGRLVVTAPPALVGSVPQSAPGPAVSDGQAGEDSGAGTAVEAALGKVLVGYASGDLEYIRAAGTTYAGLGGAAKLDRIELVRVAPVVEGGDSTARQVDVAVTWVLSGQAGKVTSDYRVELTHDSDKWFLNSIGPALSALQ